MKQRLTSLLLILFALTTRPLFSDSTVWDVLLTPYGKLEIIPTPQGRQILNQLQSSHTLSVGLHRGDKLCFVQGRLVLLPTTAGIEVGQLTETSITHDTLARSEKLLSNPIISYVPSFLVERPAGELPGRPIGAIPLKVSFVDAQNKIVKQFILSEPEIAQMKGFETGGYFTPMIGEEGHFTQGIDVSALANDLMPSFSYTRILTFSETGYVQEADKTWSEAHGTFIITRMDGRPFAEWSPDSRERVPMGRYLMVPLVKSEYGNPPPFHFACWSMNQIDFRARPTIHLKGLREDETLGGNKWQRPRTFVEDNCLNCHAFHGDGGTVSIPLEDVAIKYKNREKDFAVLLGAAFFSDQERRHVGDSFHPNARNISQDDAKAIFTYIQKWNDLRANTVPAPKKGTAL